MRIFFALFFSFLFIPCLLSFSRSYAGDMDSSLYKIQFGNVNIGSSTMTDPVDSTYTLSSTIGQTAAGQFQSEGYVVKAGFQYIYSKIPFTFSLSNITADLGTLLPNTPATTPITLTVSFGGAGQYIVTAQEETPLMKLSGGSIADTVCDGGANTCNETLAKPWTSTSAYGFGYTMSNDDITSDFIDNTYYRPFPDASASEPPAIIMQSTNVTLDLTPTPNPTPTSAPSLTGIPRSITHQSTLTFKANISPLQPAGSYQTVVHFVATPSF